MLKTWMARFAFASLILSSGAFADEASVKKLLTERLADLPVQQVKTSP